MEPFETTETETEKLGSLPLKEKPAFKFLTNFLEGLSKEEFKKFSKLTTRKSVLEEISKTDAEFEELLEEIENKRRSMELHEGTS